MSGTESPRESHFDSVIEAADKIVRAGRVSGSGATVENPVRLGPINGVLAPGVEAVFISTVFGEKNVAWFDEGREYHQNNIICEQRIRLANEIKPKSPNFKPGHVYSMFFDISELTADAPIPEDVKQMYSDMAAHAPVPDASFTSRFPLIPVRARDAAEAARIISAHLTQAAAQGWTVGAAIALVEDWRNEYEVTKGNEKTLMRFDMRPTLLSDSRLNLVALTLIAGHPKLEDALRKFAICKSGPEALTAAGIKYVDTSPRGANADSSRFPASPSDSFSGPPGGWQRYCSHRTPFNLKDRINMLNGFYSPSSARIIVLLSPAYESVIAREQLDVAPDTMGFLSPTKQLYLNAGLVSGLS